MLARETRDGGEGRRPGPAACLAWCCWAALLMGLPPVLSLPGVLDVEGEALAFSGARTLVAFGFLVGAAVRERLSTCARCAARVAGLVGSGAYVALVIGALLGFLEVTMDVSIALGLIAGVAVFLGSLGCALTLSNRHEGDSGELSGSQWIWLASCALLAVGLTLMTVGLEPCWTVSRLAFEPDGLADTGSWWVGLLYDLAGIAGPGSHALRFGVAGIDLGQLLVLAGWFVLLVLVVRSYVPLAALAGAGLGILLARALDEVLLAGLDGLRLMGAASLIVGLALLAFGRRFAGFGAASAEKDAGANPALGVLSPREREAVEGRLSGLKSSEVAASMGVRPSTVRNLQARAATKLGVASLDELSDAMRCETVDEVTVRRDHERRLLPAVLALILCCLPALAVPGQNWKLVLVAGGLTVAMALAWFAGSRCKDTSSRLGAVLVCAQLGLLCALELGFDLGAESMGPLAVRLLILADASVMSFVLLRHKDAAALSAAVLAALPLMLVDPWLVPIAYSAGVLLEPLRRGSTADMALSSLSFGCGVVLGASMSWPFFASAGLLVLRSELSGLVALSAAAGLVIGALLLLGLMSALWVARDILVEERTEVAWALTPSFDERVLSLCASRGLNETQSAIVLCMVRGMSRAEICEELSIAPGTVNAARPVAYRAFGVHSAAGLSSTVLGLLS